MVSIAESNLSRRQLLTKFAQGVFVAALAPGALAACATGSQQEATGSTGNPVPTTELVPTTLHPGTKDGTSTTIVNTTTAAADTTPPASVGEVTVSAPSTTEFSYPDHIQQAIDCGSTGEFLDEQRNPIPIGVPSKPYLQDNGVFQVVEIMGIITNMETRVVDEETGIRGHYLNVVFGKDASGKPITGDVIYGYSFPGENDDARNGLPLFQTTFTTVDYFELGPISSGRRTTDRLLPFSEKVEERFSSMPGGGDPGQYGRQALFTISMGVDLSLYLDGVTHTGSPDADEYNGIVANLEALNSLNGFYLNANLTGGKTTSQHAGDLIAQDIWTVGVSSTPPKACV